MNSQCSAVTVQHNLKTWAGPLTDFKPNSATVKLAPERDSEAKFVYTRIHTCSIKASSATWNVKLVCIFSGKFPAFLKGTRRQ